MDGFAGDVVFTAKTHAPFRVIWCGMSQEAIDLVSEIDGKDIFLHPAEPSDYAPDDRPDLPLLDNFGEITSAHWLPMSFWKEPY